MSPSSIQPAVETRLPQGTVSLEAPLGRAHAALLKAISSFGVVSSAADPSVLRVNMNFVCEQTGKGLGEIVTLLEDLQKARVSVRTLRGEVLSGFVRGAVPLDAGVWEVHLGDAGRWIFENGRGGLW